MANKKETEQILETFVHTVNASTEELLTLRDLKHILKCSFNMHYSKPKQVRKDPNKPKKPRELSEYNMFVKNTMVQLKIDKPTATSHDWMREIGRRWQEQKQQNMQQDKERHDTDDDDDYNYDNDNNDDDKDAVGNKDK